VGLLSLGGESEPKELAEIRRLLEERKGKEAEALIQTLSDRAEEDEDLSQTLEALKAAAFHHQARHKDEQRLLSGLKPDVPILREPLVLAGVIEDFGRTREDASWKALLTRLPSEDLETRVRSFLDAPPPLRHWGALRYLDMTQVLPKETLVAQYLKTLDGKACGMKAVAARRLGELADPSAEEALRKLRATPKEGGFSERNCGQDEAAIALTSIKKRQK
jgi:serine/threonine protein kinase, bacterial